MIKEGACEITPEGKIKVNIDKVVPAAQKMLEKIIDVQLSGDVNKAEDYINEYFIWDDNMETVAQSLRTVSKKLNGTLETPLADKLAAEAE